MGTALLGLLGTVVGAVTDKTKSESEASVQAFMDSNAKLMQSNTLPLVIIGGMISLAIISQAIRGKE